MERSKRWKLFSRSRLAALTMGACGLIAIAAWIGRQYACPQLLESAGRVRMKHSIHDYADVLGWTSGRDLVIQNGTELGSLDMETGEWSAPPPTEYWRIRGTTSRACVFDLPGLGQRLLWDGRLSVDGPHTLERVPAALRPRAGIRYALACWWPLDAAGNSWAGLLGLANGVVSLRYNQGPPTTIQGDVVFPYPSLSGFVVPVGVTRSRELLYWRTDGTTCSLIQLDAQPPHSRRLQVELPGTVDQMHGYLCQLSPDATRVTYVVEFGSQPPRNRFVKWLRRFVPAKRGVALWVADVDGTHARQLGAMQAGPSSEPREWAEHLSPCWNPDSRRIAFQVDGHVYLIDAAAR